jgi:hypothetical protein
MPMTASRAATVGLSTADVEAIRERLAAGRRPKVVFTETAGQMAGQVGQVVALEDPSRSDEWLVVRFGSDQLPFSPTDLTVPARGRPANGARRTPPPGRQSPAARAAAPPLAAVAAAADPPRPVPDGSHPATSPAPAPRAVKRAGKARPPRAKTPAAMTVTLAYQAGEWTVAAHQGSRTLAKPYLVRPAEALKMVAMLDVPGVHDAVDAIVTAELSEAQRRAEALRTELAEVEARLAELRNAG